MAKNEVLSHFSHFVIIDQTSETVRINKRNSNFGSIHKPLAATKTACLHKNRLQHS